MDVSIYDACGNIIGISKSPPHLDYLHTVDQWIVCHGHHIQIYNRDGSQAFQCGNGLRALSYHFDEPQNTFYIQGRPFKTYQHKAHHWIVLPHPTRLITSHFEGIPYTKVHLGNEHALFDQKWRSYQSLLMPLQQTCNLSFMRIEENHIQLETHEKGAGLTGSCGSAASAAAYLAHQTHGFSDWYIHCPKGTLRVQISETIQLTGPITLLEKISI